MSDTRPTGGLTRRQLFELVLPRHAIASSGRLELDGTKCSACTLCARECPSGALENTAPPSTVGVPAAVGASAQGGGVTLMFRQGLCDACGRCIEICPEKCLKLSNHGEASLEAGAEAAASVLFADEVAVCPACGATVGSKAMLARVHARLQVKDPVLAARLQLCPACKGKGS